MVDRFYDDYSNPRPKGGDGSLCGERKLKRRRSHLGCEHLWGLTEHSRHLHDPQCEHMQQESSFQRTLACLNDKIFVF